MSADFKKAPRIRDAKATTRTVELYPLCAACGDRAETGDHVIRRGQGGDDLIENILSLCGHGTVGCHGARHGSPYVAHMSEPDENGVFHQRRDASWVLRQCGRTMVYGRRDIIWYVLRKLGLDAGLDFLERTYSIDPIYARYLPGFPADL